MEALRCSVVLEVPKLRGRALDCMVDRLVVGGSGADYPSYSTSAPDFRRALYRMKSYRRGEEGPYTRALRRLCGEKPLREASLETRCHALLIARLEELSQ